MSPAKKRKKKEPAAESDSEKLREAIISKIRDSGAEAEGETPEPATKRLNAASPGGQDLLSREIAIFGPNLRDMAMFCRQLATLLDVGIPLLKSLKILSVRTHHPKLKRIVTRVADDVEQGNRFSDALAKFPRVFSPLFVNTVRIGEAGGILEGSVKRLAEIYESKASIRRRIAAACAYPFAALTVAIIILVVIMTLAVPKFQAIYQELSAELPKPTRIIVGISAFIRHQYVIYVPAIIAFLAVLYLFRRTATGKRFFDWCKLNLPLLSIVNVKIAVARTTRTLGSLVRAGIPLLEALGITADGSENVLVADAVRRVRDSVEKGNKLDEQMSRETHVFPPIVVDMVAIGDEAGALDIMLAKLAEIYDEEVDSTLRGLTAVVEPVLIVLLGLIVVFIALGLLLPYFHLAKIIS